MKKIGIIAIAAALTLLLSSHSLAEEQKGLIQRLRDMFTKKEAREAGTGQPGEVPKIDMPTVPKATSNVPATVKAPQIPAVPTTPPKIPAVAKPLAMPDLPKTPPKAPPIVTPPTKAPVTIVKPETRPLVRPPAPARPASNIKKTSEKK